MRGLGGLTPAPLRQSSPLDGEANDWIEQSRLLRITSGFYLLAPCKNTFSIQRE